MKHIAYPTTVQCAQRERLWNTHVEMRCLHKIYSLLAQRVTQKKEGMADTKKTVFSIQNKTGTREVEMNP